MKKGLIFLVMLGLLLVMSNGISQAISEQNFADSGYSDFLVSGNNLEKCTEWAFKSNLNITNPEKNTQIPIISIHALFSPEAVAGKPEISLFLNGSEQAISVLRPANFMTGRARVRLPRGLLLADNRLKLCARTTTTINSIIIFSDSKVGEYKEVDFFGPNSFVVSVEPKTIKVGDEFKVVVTLRNYGSRAADVELRYRKEAIDDYMPFLEFLKGPTDYGGHLAECKERDSNGLCITPGELRFEYTAKSIRATEMILLPAVVSYVDVFWDSVTSESNRLKIYVTEPEIKLRGFFVLEKEIAGVGEKVKAKLALKNDGGDKIYNVKYTVKGNLLFEGDYTGEIPIINPKETKYFEFYINSAAEGKQNLGCQLEYFDKGLVNTTCTELVVTYVAPKLDPTIVGGIILLIIAVGVYLYIVRQK